MNHDLYLSWTHAKTAVVRAADSLVRNATDQTLTNEALQELVAVLVAEKSARAQFEAALQAGGAQ